MMPEGKAVAAFRLAAAYTGSPGRAHGSYAVRHNETENVDGQVLMVCKGHYTDLTKNLTVGLDVDSNGWRVYPDE